MTNNRLEALRRQRALVAQHLAWLDAEIGAASSSGSGIVAAGRATTDGSPQAESRAEERPVSPEPVTVSEVVSDTASTGVEPGSSDGGGVKSEAEEDGLAVANARAAAILDEYAATDRFDAKATKRGCIQFAIAVFLLGVTAVLAAYYFHYR